MPERLELTCQIGLKKKRFLMDNFAEAYLQRESEEKHLKENEIYIKISYGNTHELVKNPGLNRTGEHLRKHRWCVYVEPFRKKYDISDLVKKVRFELHPSFSRTEKICDRKPFAYKCVGWGYFTLPIDIHFHDWVGLGKITIDHDLVFENEGIRKTYKIRVDKAKVPEGFFRFKKSSARS